MDTKQKITGTVFNIQHFSVHDGPGIRTVVFVKGCPLHCIWCANPESQNPAKELGWTKGKCIGCESCVHSASQYHFQFGEEGLLWENIRKDTVCQEEAERKTAEHHGGLDFEETVKMLCPSEALHVIGKTMTVEEVLEEVEKDQIFYGNSEGGITISGGEPLMQSAFTYELLREAGRRSIHRSIETTGFAKTEAFIKIAGELEYLLMDMKSVEQEIHRKYTGVSNEVILKNAKAVRESCPGLPIHFRTPVIPGVNDNEAAIKAIHDFIFPMQNVRYELLKYHRLGESKYASLHRTYEMGDAELSDTKYEALKRQFEFDHCEK